MGTVLVLATGGTIFQRASFETGCMELSLTPDQFFEQPFFKSVGTTANFTVVNLDVRSGAELSWDTIFRVKDEVVRHAHTVDGILLITGTDSMEEFAFSLDLLLQSFLRSAGRTLVITGAMLPADQLGCDGASNVRDAVKVLKDPACTALTGVLVVMNNSIHLGTYVYKRDSQLIGAFHSHPGPLGQLRGGKVVLYYQPPAPTGGSEAFSLLSRSRLKDRVPILLVSTPYFFPETLLSAELDGLILAGSGTGSLPEALVTLLSTTCTARMPIVIVSRCQTGANHDEFYYVGSKEKYESKGFIVGGPYEHLNPLQARMLLILRLSALGHG